MKYTIYQITNLVNGKIYIGAHKTSDIEDDYMGSGKYLSYAKEKHGIENFRKEILAVFDNPKDMYEMESTVVNEDFVKRKDTYNLKVGGHGGFDFVNKTKTTEQKIRSSKAGRKASGDDNARKGLQKHRDLLESDLEYRERYFFNLRTAMASMPGTFTGKTHTDEAKRKIGNANSRIQKGSGNSNYGKCWIYNLEKKQNMSVNKEDLKSYLDNGWIKGRKMTFK